VVSPARLKPSRIYVYSPWLSRRDINAIKRVAESGWISSLGPEVTRFEAGVADYIGVREAVATMNGTAAIHLALAALGIGKGDEVIIPDLTFVATAAAVYYSGATPVFADVSPQDWNLDPEDVARRRTRRTRAVIPVHLYGNPSDCNAIARAAGSGAFVLEDAAEAFGATRDGRRVGSLGDVAAFSFYANKIVTTGEGGMCTTDDRRLAKRLRLLRDHAMSPSRRYWHAELGWNYRMTALQAACGLSQLERVAKVLAAKRKLAARYAERLHGIPEVTLHPTAPMGSEGITWMYSILLPDRRTRDRVARSLAKESIETRPFFHPMTTMPPFRPAKGPARPVSLDLSRRGLNLPSGPLLTALELDRICDAIRRSLRATPGRGRIRKRD
jgi:perosamine synthetase